MSHPFYVGFGTLEALLNSHRAGAPIYIELVSESRGSGAITFEQHVLVVSDVQDGVCRYWRQRLAQSDLVAGRPMHEAEWKLAMQYAEACETAIERLIREVHKVDVQHATVAMPRELRLLEGRTDALKFDREKKAFVPA